MTREQAYVEVHCASCSALAAVTSRVAHAGPVYCSVFCEDRARYQGQANADRSARICSQCGTEAPTTDLVGECCNPA
jgi:hypothetical protein